MYKQPLYVFTDSYPYGKGETFFEEELNILSQKFEFINVVPMFYKAGERKLPLNVSLDKSLLSVSKKKIISALMGSILSIKKWKKIIPAALRQRNGNVLKTIRYGFSLSTYGEIVRQYCDEIKDENPIVYAYWMKHSALGIAKSEITQNRFVRTHGSDLYETKFGQPFHNFISKNVDFILPVSKFGKAYLEKKYNINPNQIVTSYLGTKKIENIQKEDQNNELIRIVSCSSCIPLKRVDVILKAVKHFSKLSTNRQIEYVHFGDGPSHENLKNLSIDKPDNLEISLKGFVNNTLIREYYSKNNINCFVNFSTSEGLPVSLMEALSYGIPLVAPDVGGVSEIVSDKVGVLLEGDATIDQLSNAISLVVSNPQRFSSENCQSIWSENFSAKKNYNYLVDQVFCSN